MKEQCELGLNYRQELDTMYDNSFHNYEKHNDSFRNCDNCNCDNCQGKMKVKFKFDHAAHLGEKYGEGKYKVLCVGKEGLNGHNKVDRTYSILEVNNPHYRGTIYTLALLDGKEPESTGYNALKEFKEIHKQFCLTNYFKCAFQKNDIGTDKAHGLPVNANMKNNCFKILLKEIEILKPDIVIMQGKFTSKPFWDALKRDYELQKLYPKSEKKECGIFLEKYTSNNYSFYVLWSYHPATARWHSTLEALKEAIDVFKKDFAKDAGDNI